MPRRSRLGPGSKIGMIGAGKAPLSRVERTSQVSPSALDTDGSLMSPSLDTVLGPLSDYDGDRRFRVLPLSDDSDSDSSGDEAHQDPCPTVRMACFFFQSVLFHANRLSVGSLSSLHALLLVLTPFCLWSCAGHPICLVSRASLIASALLFCMTAYLCDTIHAAYQFIQVTFVLLLAIFTHANSPFSKMVILYLSTLCNAGLLGYAFAELRARTWSDTLVDDVSSSRKIRPAPPVVSLSILSLVCVGRVFWITWAYTTVDTAGAVVEFSILASMCMFLWASLLHVWLLHSYFFSGNDLSMLFCSVMMIFCAMTGILSTLGTAGFVTLVWLIAMGIAAFLGFTVSLYHCYKGWLEIRRETSTPGF